VYNNYMEICVGISKVSKYAVSDSGDTAEVVERPNGGLSVVLADGQSSGRGAKDDFYPGSSEGHRSIS